jgi:hypothetical protein
MTERRLRRLPAVTMACFAIAAAYPMITNAADAPLPRVATVAAQLATPPDDARPMVRWWWFGPAVDDKELARELAAMKQGGFGGVEIQPVYPMEHDDPARGIRNEQYLSPAFLGHVSFANKQARSLGLRVDMTLSSGWPYGGPHVAVSESASRLRVARIAVPAGALDAELPVIMSGEKLIASFIGAGDKTHVDATALKQFAPAAQNGRTSVAPSAQARMAVYYIASRTGQQVKRAALGGEGFVIDHLNPKAVTHHLDAVAKPLLKAFGDKPPYAVFSDSLEVYATDWTDDFLAEFARRRGYDLTPYLPLIDSGQGPDAAAVRHDWAQTQTELVNERYLTPVNAWADAHKTRFRSQTYGEPAVTMSSNRLVSLPEGEGPQFRSFSFTRWATSSGHLYGKPVISAETWTWLHSPAFMATPLDMKAEADRMLLQGVNHFIGHGWPYTPSSAPEPGYAFYAAAVFNDHLPWWNVMPEVTSYLQRTSYLLRQGAPANEIAVYLPTDDVYAMLTPGKVSVSAEMGKFVTPTLTEQILDAGHNLDYVDAESITALGIKHSVLVLPHVRRMSPAILAKLTAYVRGGGKLIIVGDTPSTAPGLLDAARISSEVAAAAKALLSMPGVQQVADDAAVGAAVAMARTADLALAAHASDVGFIHRKLADADLYFIANTGNTPVRTTAVVHAARRYAAWWNPFDGKVTAASMQPSLELALAPYESRVLVLSDAPQPGVAPAAAGGGAIVADLSADWSLQFPGQAKPQTLPALRSWTDDPATRYFSGQAIYTKQFTLDAAQLKQARVLDFGPGTALTTTPKVPAGMRAMLESPVREAAVVFVNGKRAGVVWHPPYQLDVASHLRAGANTVEVRVANLAINTLAGRTLPDYRLLSARYGQRFIPQDTELIQPQASGILGPVRLMGDAP